MRIWVARPEPGATRTASRLATLGHQPLVAPVLAAAPTGAPLPLGRFSAVVFTSAYAVRVLSPDDRARLRAVPAFAVGARTGTLAKAAGFSDVRIADGDAIALARLIDVSLPVPATLLHLTGVEHKAEPAASLTKAGYTVSTCETYRMGAVASLPPTVADAFATGALDAMLHYSRRSAEVARDLSIGAGRSGAFRALTHYCLSADVAVPLVAAGVAVHFVPERPDEDALFAGLTPPGATGI